MPNGALEKIAEKLDGRQVITSGDLLEQRRQDWWNASNIRNLSTNPVPCPAGVVQPKTLEDVQNIVRIASEFKTPIVPYGLGSGVCGGIQTQGNEILLDMSKMNRVRQIDEANMLAWFDAGKRGIEAEQDVAQKGFTIGHWPQSIDLSSVGGWVATRASGQYSTAYGNIEDIVYAIEAVLPNGEVIVAGKSPRA